MTIALIFTFALLTAPIAFIKRSEIDPALRSTVTITDYLLYRVAFKGAMLAAVVLTGIFLAVTFAENNPTVYIGPLVTFSFNTALAIVGGVMLPWLTILAVYAIRQHRSRTA